MKVFVTGVNGLIGSNLIRVLLARGYDVVGMLRPTSSLISLRGLDFKKYIGDILNPEDVLRAAQDCRIIIHLAANTIQWPTALKYYSANIQGTINVINAAKKVGVEKFIYVNTANSFGYGTKENPGNEQCEFRLLNFKSGYIQSKYKAQQIVLKEVKSNKLPAIILNPTFTLGPYDAKPSSGRIISLVYGKKILGYPPGGKNFVHVHDVAIGICNAIQMGRIGECYLLGHQNLTYEEFFKKLIRITGMKVKIFKVPSSLYKIVGLSGTIYEKLFRKEFPLANYTHSRLLCIGNYYTSDKAINELNLPQTPIEYAIKDAYNWFKSNGYLNAK